MYCLPFDIMYILPYGKKASSDNKNLWLNLLKKYGGTYFPFFEISKHN